MSQSLLVHSMEAYSLGLYLPSVLWHCWLGHFTRKKTCPYNEHVYSPNGSKNRQTDRDRQRV